MCLIHHRITGNRHRIVGFWSNMDPNNSQIKENIIFPEVYIVVQELCASHMHLAIQPVHTMENHDLPHHYLTAAGW